MSTPWRGSPSRMNGHRRWYALVLLCMGSLMIVLDTTIVNVALPSIRDDLGFSETSLAWVVNAYMLTFGGFLLLGGRLGDLFGHRRLFLAGIATFTLASLCCGLATSQETIDALRAVGVRMGKEIVVVNEAPGFVTSRINALIGNEAFRMLEAGIASAEDIDKALKLGLNHPMGPFELVDLVGLDTRLAVLENLYAQLGELYRPSPLLRRYVSEGRLGKKVGRGVFDYDK